MSNSMAISATAIAPDALRRQLFDHTAGALVTFEGWIRNKNEGRTVLRLAYEVYRPMAVPLGNDILSAAISDNGALAALAVHREGELELGDCAVWVGVVSQHRDAAFRACREVIDRIKDELPIWKKEFYVDGDSGWINCERCTTEAHAGT